MHVGFEAKRFFNNFTGLGNYSRFIIRALSDFAPENSYTLFSPRIRSHPEYDAILSRPNINTVGPSGLYKALPSLWRSFGVSRTSAAAKLDVFHGLSQEIPSGLPARTHKVVTVHDLIFLRFPQYYNPIDVAIYKAKVRSACKNADRVIAISEQTARDIVEFLNIDRAKISVVYQGCHPVFSQRASSAVKEQVRSKYRLPEKFILNVGTIEERKNAKQLVEALHLLPHEHRRKIVFVGRETKYKEDILQTANSLGLSDHLQFIHNAAFSDLPAIYQMAEVFVYPSKFEGFGIPLIEAIESGVPVISSTGSCFTEAAGPTALYADPSDASSLASQLQRVLGDSVLKDKMISESLNYIKKFSPEIIATDLINVYRNISSDRARSL